MKVLGKPLEEKGLRRLRGHSTETVGVPVSSRFRSPGEGREGSNPRKHGGALAPHTRGSAVPVDVYSGPPDLAGVSRKCLNLLLARVSSRSVVGPESSAGNLWVATLPQGLYGQQKTGFYRIRQKLNPP